MNRSTDTSDAKPTVRLQARSLSFSWAEKPVLRGIGLELYQGEMFGLLGPNGAGKTTLISLIAGLIQPGEGELSVAGFCARTQAHQARSKLGFVFQSVSLDRFMTVEQNLNFAAGLQGLSRAETLKSLERLYHLFPIQGWLKKPVGSLSGGQKRLVDIARAMIHQPQILILDEPTSALDVPSKKSVWDVLKNMQQQVDLTILVATHLMDEATTCNRVGFLNRGELKWLGTPAEALDELPDQSVTSTRNVTLADWFVWKLRGDEQ